MEPVPSHSSLSTHMPVPQLKLLLDEEYYELNSIHRSGDCKTTGYGSASLSSCRRSFIRVPAVSPELSSYNEFDPSENCARAPSTTPVIPQDCVSAQKSSAHSSELISYNECGRRTQNYSEVQLSDLEAYNSSSRHGNRENTDDLDFISPYELEIISHIKDGVTSPVTPSDFSSRSPVNCCSSEPNPDQSNLFDGKGSRSAPPRVIFIPTSEWRIEPIMIPKYECPRKIKTEINLSSTMTYNIESRTLPVNKNGIHSNLFPKISCKKSIKKVNKSAPTISYRNTISNNNLSTGLKDALKIHSLNRLKSLQ